MKRWRPALVLLCLLGLIYGVLSPIVYEQIMSRKFAGRSSCYINIRGLGTATLMYAQDYDDRFPYPATAYKSLLFPYTKNSNLVRCPLDAEGVVSYTMYPNLQGVLLKMIERPDQVVLLYEGKEGKLNFRHSGSAAITFADGHAKMVKEEDAKDLIWRVTPPRNGR